jgi:hypothetical protein
LESRLNELTESADRYFKSKFQNSNVK